MTMSQGTLQGVQKVMLLACSYICVMSVSFRKLLKTHFFSLAFNAD